MVSLRVETDAGELVLERVPFDTEVFGFDVGRIASCRAPSPSAVAFEALHRAGIERARAAGFKHLSRRVLGDDHAEIRGLEAAGHRLVDVGVIFDHDLRGVTPGVPHGDGVKVATEADIERVVAECAAAFRTSRYYHDPVFTEGGGDEVHRRWIWNSFRGRADAVLVLADVTAFVTCAVDAAGTGNIALFGVAPSGQGKGAGQRLLRGALGWFAERAKRVEVKTQAINYAASRMYERGGFRLFRSELTFALGIDTEARG